MWCFKIFFALKISHWSILELCNALRLFISETDSDLCLGVVSLFGLFYLIFSFPAHIQSLIQHCSLSKTGQWLEAVAFYRKRFKSTTAQVNVPPFSRFLRSAETIRRPQKLDCVSHYSCLWLRRRWLTASARRPLDYTNQVWLLLFAVFKLNQFFPDLLLLRLGSHSRTNKCKNFKSLNKYSCTTLIFLALVSLCRLCFDI